MRKIILAVVFLGSLIAAAAIAFAPKQESTNPQAIVTIKNRTDAPVKITDASFEKGVTLQFDESGQWNAVAIRWTLNFGKGHDFMAHQFIDKAIGQDGHLRNATFTPGYIAHMKTPPTSFKDKNGTPLQLQSATVEVVFVLKGDGKPENGNAWGNATPDASMGEADPYTVIMNSRKSGT